MKLKTTKKGFTLIELLVVITIIGILATGAVVAFTSQIQKARDATRISDVEAISTSSEQYYQDYDGQYPVASDFNSGTTLGAIRDYMPALPKDPKSGQTCNNGGTNGEVVYCDYVYAIGVDGNGIERGAYEVSTAFEANSNVATKAIEACNGSECDDLRWEKGTLGAGGIGELDTSLDFKPGTTEAGATASGFVIAGSGKVLTIPTSGS